MGFEGCAGSKLIGRLSALGVEGYGFNSHFPDSAHVRISDYTTFNGCDGSFDNSERGS